MKRVFSVFCLLVSLAAQATVIPDGNDFLIGTLDNGLTYYLCHNESPKGCADFYIAHNVGALQEDDNQNGLAHFLEHMAFNGTRHYPEKALLNFLAKEGVRFGYNVNAYTNRSETVYNISRVPLVRETFVDSVLLVLRDWSCDISCEQDDIDAERGVIHEEWRNRDGQRYRMATRQSALLYKGGKHPDRTVLGDMDIILNFKREELLDFYHRWYRPDLQAIIVVGDIDPVQMEKRVKAMFSDIPASSEPEQKGNYAPPVLTEPLFEDMTDPQLRYTTVKVFSKQDVPDVERNSTEFFKDLFARQIVTQVVSEHLERACLENDSPAKSAVLVLGDETPYFYLSQFTITPREKSGMTGCLALACREMERVKHHGISEAEFNQAKVTVMKRFRLGTGDASPTTDNTEIAKACVDNFLHGMPCLTPEDMRVVKREILMALEYSEVAPYARSMFSSDAMIYSNCYNDHDVALMPSEDQMRAVIDSVRKAPIEAGYIAYAGTSLEVDPAPGRIVKTSAVKEKDFQCWTLSNGAKVWWSQVEPVKAGVHLVMELRYDTGFNAFPVDEIPSVVLASSFISRHSGFSGSDRTALMNGPAMSGLTYYSGTIKGRYAGISINASQEKVEDAFKLVHLRSTDPFYGLQANLDRARLDALQTLAKGRTSADIFASECDLIRFGNHPWLTQRDTASVLRVDMDYVQEVFEKLYGDPSKLQVYITSDAPKETIRDYVEKYIASLPVVSKSSSKPKNKRLVPVYAGDIHHSGSYKARTSPHIEVDCSWLRNVRYSPEALAACDILDHIMSARYLARIREERGGTYHVSFSSTLYRHGRKAALESSVKFRTRAELQDVLIQDVYDIMDEMCEKGPDPEEMEKAIRYLVKYDSEKSAHKNVSVTYRNSMLMDYARNGDKDYDYPAVLSSVSAEDVRRLACSIRSGSKFRSVYEER